MSKINGCFHDSYAWAVSYTHLQKLEESQSVQTQLQMNLDSQTSLAKIESVATEDLGMKRVVQNQMNYIGLSEGDKGEVVTDTNSNWLASAWNAIVNLLS